ncbi:ABC transporter permease subunit [soil metagenome]
MSQNPSQAPVLENEAGLVDSHDLLRRAPQGPGQRRRVRIPLALIGPVLMLGLWWVAASADLVSEKLLPGPVETLTSLWTSLLSGEMLLDIGPTLLRTVYAFLIAAGIGIPIGVILGSSAKLYRTMEFVIDFFRSTPVTAVFPLFLLIFGIGDAAKISVAAFAAGLIVLFNVAYGVMSARQTRIMASKVMGASRTRILKDVMFFESLTQTFVGLRTGVSIALVVIIVAEMFIGSDSGMGHRIIDAQQVYDLTDMYSSILVTGAIGYGFNRMFLALDRRLIHWAGH